MPLDLEEPFNDVFTKRRIVDGNNQIFNQTTKRWIGQQTTTGTAYINKHKLTKLGNPKAHQKAVYIETRKKVSRGWTFVNYYRENQVSISIMANSILSKLHPDMDNILLDIRGIDEEAQSFFRTIKLHYGMKKKDLFNKINETQFSGEFVLTESGGFELDTELDTSFFRLRYRQLKMKGYGARKDLKTINTEYFKAKSFPSEHGDCLLAILKDGQHISTIRHELGIEGPITLNDIPKLEKYFAININILNDVVTTNKKFRKNKTTVTIDYDYYYETQNLQKGKCIDILLKDEHYSLIIEYKELYFDPICGDKLVSTKSGPKEMSDLAIRKSLIRQGRKLTEENKVDEENYETKFIFFDIETIFNPYTSDILEPYSVAWHVASLGPPRKFSDKNLDKIIEETYFLRGKGCLTKFVRWIENNDTNIKYILIGYNNSRFDNFALLKSVIKIDSFTRMNFVQNSILPLTFSGRHVTFDLCRFVMSSLKDACNNFKTFPKKLDGFSHYEPQNAFMEGGWPTLDNWMDENSENLIKYNKIDVLSTENLFHTVRIAYQKMTGVDILEYSTLAQLTYDTFKKSIRGTSLKIPAPVTWEDDKFIRDAITGGRCQDFKQEYDTYEELACVDVKSLYPFIMLNRRFPIGEYIPTKKYQEKYLGIYSVKITKQPEIKIIPNRGEETLDWEYEGEIVKNLTSIEIECLKRNGGEVEFLTNYQDKYVGMYWPTASNKLFKKYFTPIKDEKTKQDKLNDAKDTDYNPALRNITKLLLNSLSGKFVQRNFEDVIEMIKNGKEQDKFDKKTKDQEVKMIIGDYRLLSGPLIEEKIYKPKSAKPSYIGVFIYAYARTYMYDLIYSRYPLLYTDTDSAILKKSDYQDFKTKFIETVGLYDGNCSNIHRVLKNEGKTITIGSEFGQFEEEFKASGKFCESYIIGKKMYCVEIKNEKGVIQKESKYRLKGVNLTRDRFISKKIADKIDSIKDTQERMMYVYKLKQELDYEYENLLEIFDKNGNSKQRLLSIEIFRALSKGEAYFLCGQIKKVDCMTMKQAYTTKIVKKDGSIEVEIGHHTLKNLNFHNRMDKKWDTHNL